MEDLLHARLQRQRWEAYQKVKANKGAPGVDGQSVADFEKDLKNKPGPSESDKAFPSASMTPPDPSQPRWLPERTHHR
jgi:hypothetical protein